MSPVVTFYLLCFCAAALVATAGLSLWGKISKRHKDAFHIAVYLRGVGLDDLAELFEDYASGDFPGLNAKAVVLRRVWLKSPEAFEQQFAKAKAIVDAKAASAAKPSVAT